MRRNITMITQCQKVNFRLYCTERSSYIPLAPVQNSVSLKLMQRKTLNFVINLPDLENITQMT